METYLEVDATQQKGIIQIGTVQNRATQVGTTQIRSNQTDRGEINSAYQPMPF